MNFTIYPNLLGKGAFGSVYLGIQNDTGKLVAVKTEEKGTEGKSAKILKHENDMLKLIQEPPLGFWCTREKCFMVIPIMGPSLDHLHAMCGTSFSFKTCQRMGIQMIDSIEHIHRLGVLHRDIKPANFLVNYSLPHTRIKLVDYGLSKRFTDENGNHIPFKTGVSRVGSLRYMSKYTHQGIESSCRDDIYSIVYVIIFLRTGALPWKGLIKDLTMDEKHKVILRAKQQCTNKHFAQYFEGASDILDYTDTLTFGEKPDYRKIRNCIASENLNENWDWDMYFTVNMN